MQGETEFAVELAELEAVVSSGVFARSPNLAQMLKYICEMHFRGESRSIKEYNIAVEAFGRPADFDPTRDSIVRVEAHRLRKRLQEFYNGPGSGHALRIQIPSGSYMPQFVPQEEPATATTGVVETAAVKTESPVGAAAGAVELAEAAAVAAPSPDKLEGLPAKPPLASSSPALTRRQWAIACAAIIGVTVVGYWAYSALRNSAARSPNGIAAAAPEPPLLTDEEVRIMAGSTTPKLLDHAGNIWLGDRYFTGGMARSVHSRPIAFTQDAVLYHRFREGDFTYDIPLKKNYYELRLYFAETVFGEDNVGGGGETTRVFRVQANGQDLLRYVDVVSDAAGSNTAYIRVFKDIQPAADGVLHLAFVTVNNERPFVNGIELVPSRQGAIRPIRILARDSSYTDQKNRLWSPDRYFHNGVLVQRHEVVSGTEDQTLFQSERFGTFSYSIPVATKSRYTVTMKFCEAWFGADRPAGGGVAGRVFDIGFNGRPLVTSLDVFKEAGSLHALEKTFTGLEPSQHGQLHFTFLPLRNYAMVDAIEVLDEAWK